MTKVLDLQAAASPEDALRTIRGAIDAYQESSEELRSAWSEGHKRDHAGRAWEIIANELDKAHDRIVNELRKIGYPLNR